MDLKLYLVILLHVLSLIHVSIQCEPYTFSYGAGYNDYYMNIKTSVDLQWMHREDNAQWRNDSLFEAVDCYPDRCKVQLDHRDNCYLYLVKNQTKSTLHGPIKIDPKHIELDIKFDKSNRTMNHPYYEWEIRDKRRFELRSMYFSRCYLMRLAYKLVFDLCRIPLNIYLELDSKTASLFPKIEQNDYFMLNIINFFDEINPNNVFNKSVLWRYYPKLQYVTASHIISNYTVVPMEKFNKI
uniref:Uncharacterized protein n=1 Tax=Tetranychus urticae TaxID=32264 RepID=T1JWW8_TETUR